MNKVLPDRPLEVKCVFNQIITKDEISFTSAQDCTYDVLRHNIEQCFQLSGSTFSISYEDNNREVYEIRADEVLTDAIQYFQDEEAHVSSPSSNLPGPSRGTLKITLAVENCDSLSLSGTSSVTSGEDLRHRSQSEASLSFDFDEDAIAVSSRDSGRMEDQIDELSLKRAETGTYYYDYMDDRVPPEPSHSQKTGLKQWVAAQREAASAHHPHPQSHHSDPSLYTIVPAESLQDIPFAPPAKEDITGCSQCSAKLDHIKYVCSTCGEKDPALYQSTIHKGKSRDSLGHPPSAYTEFFSPPLSPTFSSSSKTFIANQTMSPLPGRKPLPPVPSSGRPSTPVLSPMETGYELCHNCIETAGVTHAIEAVAEPGSSPTANSVSPFSSFEDAALQWRRAAPKNKGQLRHAYLEKMWAHRGWTDVVQSEAEMEDCSACGVTVSLQKLYKCASCQRHYLCRACYSKVHDYHPSHAFLVLPDKPPSLSDSEITLPDPSEEQFMVHPGVKCMHCYLDIIGARFHCAECDSVDICSSCESVGLPGNIDSADGGHISSHILIKFPLPLTDDKVQSLSRKAMKYWIRDPANINSAGNSKANSERSSHARTVVRTKTVQEERNIDCDACKKPISEVWYQCANCPTPQSGYNLCSTCEEVSYESHNPLHAFFKLSRGVHRPIRSKLNNILYKMPAGPTAAAYDSRDPTGYLRSVIHPVVACDRCFTLTIQGAWFHCAHCGKDLCSSCESVDTHDDTHVFLVLKSLIDMQELSYADKNLQVIPHEPASNVFIRVHSKLGSRRL